MSEKHKMSRRDMLSLGMTLSAAGQAGSAGTSRVHPFELEEVSIPQLQKGLEAGEYTSQRLVSLYLERIDEIDQRGPAINQILEINPDALQIAAILDQERRAGHLRGPLHGIPILLKDNIATCDRTSTTAGSLALVGSIPPHEASLATRLRDCGAILLGKTNMSEWANFRSTHPSSGWSGRGGQTRNPYVLDRTPSGSSSGSAGAVAASFAAAAVGTETDGSILSPSAASSLVGIKPTLGLISRTGIVPIAHSQDTAGPMARTVRDAAILLSALVCSDGNDPATHVASRTIHADYTRFLDADGLKGARIGIARNHFFGYSQAADRIAETAIGVMKAHGAILIDPADIPTAGKFDDSETEVLLYEFKADLNRYLAWLGPHTPVHTLREIIAFNEINKAHEMPFFGQELMLQAQKKGALTSATYRKALEKNHRLSRVEGIDAIMSKHQLDALFAPTGGPPWPIDLANGDGGSGSSTTPAAVAGYPSITVPAGYFYGLPVGVSFFGRAWTESTLLRIAYAFEQASRVRLPPTFFASAPFPARGKP
jgi:amidase